MELTPLLGVLAGVVASLILLALGIVLVLRLRGRDCDEKQQKTIMATDLKRSNESVNSLEKNPDIIPHNNGTYRFVCLFVSLLLVLCYMLCPPSPPRIHKPAGVCKAAV